MTLFVSLLCTRYFFGMYSNQLIHGSLPERFYTCMQSAIFFFRTSDPLKQVFCNNLYFLSNLRCSFASAKWNNNWYAVGIKYFDSGSRGALGIFLAEVFFQFSLLWDGSFTICMASKSKFYYCTYMGRSGQIVNNILKVFLFCQSYLMFLLEYCSVVEL